MILGHGSLAQVLQDKEDLLFFASGVSNSSEIRESEYKRERDLLLEQRRDLRIVYFSSLGVLDGDTRYYRHKRDMEAMIKENFPKYCIIRIGNITWGDNPHTLINFLRDKINNNLHYKVQDVYRYIVDKDEFLYWVNLIPDWNVEMNIPGERLKVVEIVNRIKKGEL